MPSKESIKRENTFWEAAAQRSGSPKMYQVEDTTPLGVGVYKPTPKPSPAKKDES